MGTASMNEKNKMFDSFLTSHGRNCDRFGSLVSSTLGSLKPALIFTFGFLQCPYIVLAVLKKTLFSE